MCSWLWWVCGVFPLLFLVVGVDRSFGWGCSGFFLLVGVSVLPLPLLVVGLFSGVWWGRGFSISGSGRGPLPVFAWGCWLAPLFAPLLPVLEPLFVPA